MKYDLHMHTNFSPCAAMKPVEILKRIYRKDIDGIAITDHNTIHGALEVVRVNKELSKKGGIYSKELDIVLGSEIKTNFGDLLVYYQNDEIKSRDFFEVVDAAKSQDALLSIAHPFRLVPWHNFDFRQLKEILSAVDAIEAFNSRTLYLPNVRASWFANKHNVAKTGGSDAHFYFDLGNGYTEFEGDLRSALRNRNTKVGGTVRFGWLSGVMGCVKRRVVHRVSKLVRK